MNKIYVVCPGRMCFYVDAETLDPFDCAFYDPYWNVPYAPQPQMGYSEWTRRYVPMLMERYANNQ